MMWGNTSVQPLTLPTPASAASTSSPSLLKVRRREIYVDKVIFDLSLSSVSTLIVNIKG